MTRLYYVLFLSVSLLACSKQNEVGGAKETETFIPCGTYKSGQKLFQNVT
ncbi:hypothetical protein ACQKLG_00210 [Pedobacter suwonensis]